MGVWYDFYQTSGGAISRTSEERASEWYHTNTSFDKIISQCHPCDYLFIIYHNTRTNRNFVHTYHSHIYYTSTHCHFLTLQIAVCLSCQTQQAMHNALCDVLWPNKYGKKNMEKNPKKIPQKKYFKKIISKKLFQKNISKKIISIFFLFFLVQKQNLTKINFQNFFPHKICIVSHSSYHTRRITLVVSHSHATSGGIWRILVR